MSRILVKKLDFCQATPLHFTRKVKISPYKYLPNKFDYEKENVF